MPEFEDIQAALASMREQVAARARDLFLAGEEIDRLKDRRTELDRLRSTDPDIHPPPDMGELDARIADREAARDGLIAALGQARGAEADLLGRFRDFSDPREHIGQLSDGIPICLLPLRIEYRFKPADEVEGDLGELWVRVYPDDISVDSFEQTLTETEAQDLRTYWAGIWSAGGVESAERGAWKVLLAGQGAGRSHWATTVYAPTNSAGKPVPPAEGPWIILSIPTRAPLPSTEADALRDYWTAVWRAGDDQGAQIAATQALVLIVGEARAEILRRDYVPRNLADPPPGAASREETTVVVAFLHFPTDAEAGLRAHGWATTPEARTLPDRLMLMGFNDGELELERLGEPIPPTLAVAPDPSAEKEDQLQPDGADLKISDEIAWLTDFDRAVADGMGFRIPLERAAFARGFNQLMVLGLRLRADAEAGRLAFEELINHHHRAKSGFSILPQGRPTNNVEGEGAAYSWREDPDVSFDHYFRASPDDPTGWYEKCDGRWLAEMLGLDPARLTTIPYYGRTDIADAKAMNVALWPATLGYFMQSMMHPVFEDRTIDQVRDFFTRHVSARGIIPAIRVGRQPYGILPVTARSRLRWFAPQAIGAAPRPGGQFLLGLYGHLRRIELDLAPLLDKVAFIGKETGDPQKMLLDIIGLHSGSVEFQQRYAESLQQLYNRLRLNGAGSDLLSLAIVAAVAQSGVTLLESFGYQQDPQEPVPDILEKFFTTAPNLLKGPIIDDRPLSETEKIRPYTEAGENYIAWLASAAATSHDALRLQEGFAEGTPRALLYLMLHHALDLSFVETSIHLYLNAGLMTQAQVKAARREPPFVQMTEAALADQESGSRWRHLYAREAAITGDVNRSVGAFIPTVLTTMQATAYLNRQLQALERLKDRPTAALERVFAEHLDLCSYRLDAWYGGLMSAQLEDLRLGGEAPATGLYLGAWGWLEEVKPEFKSLEPVKLPDDLDQIFNAAGPPPLTSDSQNQGYIHAPSLNHAVTAAILRNGYLSNATSDAAETLAINLSSERVRMALQTIEGMKADQSLGALLGYQFERGLHDRHDVEVDAFIYDLRMKFPIGSNRLRPTRTPPNDETGRPIRIRQIEARNVIDGLELVEHMKSGDDTYPFGFDDLPAASPAQAAAISQEAQRLADIADAVADLAMAEAIHQVAQGNYDRAGATLDTYSKGKFPATPDVIRTPRTGVGLTHRMALHLETGLDPNDFDAPRARAEPALDRWLAGLLPDPDRVACNVTVTDPAGGPAATHVVTQADLGLAPIDLLYLLDPSSEEAATTLDDLIEVNVVTAHTPPPDASLAISYRDRIPAIDGHVPFFELAALTRPLRQLLVQSRPLRPTDMGLAGESAESQDLDIAIDEARLTLNQDDLETRRGALDNFGTALQTLIDSQNEADPTPTQQIVTGIDGSLTAFIDAMRGLAPFAELDTGTAAILADRRRIYADMRATLAALLARWEDRLAEFDQAISDYDADPTADSAAKFRALLIAERFIATSDTDPLPADPDDFRNDLVNTRRPVFVAERDTLGALGASAQTLAGLHDGLDAERAAIADLDPEPLDLSAHVTRIVTLAEDMARRATTLTAEIARRLQAIQARLDAANDAADPRAQVEERRRAAKLLLGDDFQIVPDFALPPALGAEWRSAWGAGPTASRAILAYQETELERPFPVDDWLMGVARVRERMHAVETVNRLHEAFGGAGLDLQPLQFPNRPGLPWLGLDFPEELSPGEKLIIDEDKLLHTGIHAVPFDETQRQAGLLFDEWTEVIPSRTEDTGIAFHYDRPNSEPPQALLLALPVEYTGSWQWADLVDAVRETMDLARKRAIEPDQIDSTAYARFLPAVILAVTLYPLTASLNFSFNNGLATTLAAAGGGSNE